jgi:hypothetical protein
LNAAAGGKIAGKPPVRLSVHADVCLNTAARAYCLREAIMNPELLCLEKSCAFCGARLEVSSAALPGQPKAHIYTCPQCGKPDEIECTGHPHVRVLAQRNDGRSGLYQETMF